uniref:Uncharacterized protein n=1 Tax=Rhizophora mucronata TaxID=61149 RepID=A0A2P2N3N5_RHIMU
MKTFMLLFWLSINYLNLLKFFHYVINHFSRISVIRNACTQL